MEVVLVLCEFGGLLWLLCVVVVMLVVCGDGINVL